MALLLALTTYTAHAQENAEALAQTQAEATEKTETTETTEATEATEEALYYGVSSTRQTVRSKADEKAGELGKLEEGATVDVYAKGRTWTRIDFGGEMGYVKTKHMERIQQKDPFAGSMPGVSEHVAVGYVLEDFSFIPEGYKYPVKVKEGSWLSIESIKDDRAYFPYKREPENVSVKTKRLKIYDFVPWNEAQPGDLLYAFTSFYTTSLNKEGNSGRLHNIRLAADRLTSIRVEEGGTFSFNETCGPYTKENGYRSAPILSGESEMGYGGGVCQVCSTFYNIVLRVPMVIEEMHWHSQGGVSYLPAGFDATVGSEHDLIVRNVLPYPLRIEFETLDGVMTAFLFRDYED